MRSNETASDPRRSVARIAQYRPFGDGEGQVEYARRQFLLAAAHENGGKFSSLAEGRDVCQALWGLDIDIDEMRELVRRLEKAGKLRKAGASYELTKEAAEELADRLREASTTEATAFAEWEASTSDLCRGLTHEQRGELREDLAVWLQRLISRYGIEAARVLYPDQEGGVQLVNEIQELRLDFLPERDAAVEQVRPKALYTFIQRPTLAQRTYLANLMTTGYLVAVFTLDPEGHEMVQSVTQGQRVYLDTNVVYDVLNLSGPSSYLSIHRVLKMTQQLGYEVRVTRWTIEEMKKSVRGAREKLARSSLPPRALAEIAAEASGEESFITAYWRRYKETGVNIKDFLDLHEQIEPLLAKYGIEVEEQGCIATDQDRRGLAEQVSLLETVPGGAEKSHPIQEHDVKHRLLVERLRGNSNRRFSNAGYWFLTNDTVLVPYAAEGRDNRDAPPFAVSVGAWAHIVRSLCPRTEDYEQTLVDLLNTASVRPRGVVGYATVAEVLGRIDMLVDDSTEDIATRIMLDDALLEQVEARDGDERRDFIDAAVKEKKEHMEQQLLDLQDQVTAARAAQQQAEQGEADARAALEQEKEAHRQAAERASRSEAERQAREEAARQQAIEKAEAEADRARQAEEKALKAKEAEARDRSEDVAALTERVEKQEKINRIVVAVAIALIAAALVVVPLATGLVTDGWPLIGIILGGAGTLGLAIAWLVGGKMAWKMASIAVMAVGAVASLQQLVTSDDDDEPPAPRQR